MVSTNPAAFDLRFDKLELRSPSSELFSPPAGFTKYESFESMMNELAARQHDIRRTGVGAVGPGPQFEEPRARP